MLTTIISTNSDTHINIFCFPGLIIKGSKLLMSGSCALRDRTETISHYVWGVHRYFPELKTMNFLRVVGFLFLDKAITRSQWTSIDWRSVDIAEGVFEILVRSIKERKLRPFGKSRLTYILRRLLDGSLLMRCPDRAGLRSKLIVQSKGKKSRVPGAGFGIEDDGPWIIIEDRLRYSSDVMKKRHMSLNDIHQGFTRGEVGKNE